MAVVDVQASLLENSIAQLERERKMKFSFSLLATSRKGKP